MSMNFSTLKELKIPEGNVTKITDASGVVLWEAGPTANVFGVCWDTSNSSTALTRLTPDTDPYQYVRQKNRSLLSAQVREAVRLMRLCRGLGCRSAT